MNENAQLWVKALRSGDYQQTQHYLRHDGGYCCLGVASELFRQQTGSGSWGDDWDGDNDSSSLFGVGTRDWSTTSLVEPVREWLGLRTSAGSYLDEERSEHSLGEDNDDGATFEEIANIIEAEPPGLFV